MEYDPDNPPNPTDWLALGPEERTRLIEQYFEREEIGRAHV